MSAGTAILIHAGIFGAVVIGFQCCYAIGRYDERKKWNLFLLSCRDPDNRIHLLHDPKHEDTYRRV